MKKITFKQIFPTLMLGVIPLTMSSCDSSGSSDSGGDSDSGEIAVLHNAFNDFTGNVSASLAGDNVTVITDGLPDHTSPYWSESHPLYVEPTVTNEAAMAPGNIDDFNGSYSLTVDATPSLANGSTATGLGAIGIATSGAVIYNDEEGPNVPLDNAVVSLDYTAGHTGPQSYHYHLEPKAWSDNDTALIGIMADGFFLYGRIDSATGGVPTDLDDSGGHFGPTPHNPDGEYHYHIQSDLYLGEYYILFPGDYQGTPSTIQ